MDLVHQSLILDLCNMRAFNSTNYWLMMANHVVLLGIGIALGLFIRKVKGAWW